MKFLREDLNPAKRRFLSGTELRGCNSFDESLGDDRSGFIARISREIIERQIKCSLSSPSVKETDIRFIALECASVSSGIQADLYYWFGPENVTFEQIHLLFTPSIPVELLYRRTMSKIYIVADNQMVLTITRSAESTTNQTVIISYLNR